MHLLIVRIHLSIIFYCNLVLVYTTADKNLIKGKVIGTAVDLSSLIDKWNVTTRNKLQYGHLFIIWNFPHCNAYLLSGKIIFLGKLMPEIWLENHQYLSALDRYVN